MNASSILERLMMLGITGLIALFLSVPAKAESDAKKKNPTSKLFVVDVEGISQINDGDKIEDLSRKSVYLAQGAIIQTKPNATNAIVLSNGTGVFFDHDTSMEVNRFVQEPFTPNRTDMEVEPSISQTRSYLSHGTVGLCTSKPVAGSSMIYRTQHASIAIRGKKIAIETNDQMTKVSLFEGDATVRGGDLDIGGQQLRPGQQAIITDGKMGEPNTIVIQDIPPAEAKILEDKVTAACMAKSTVYFEVANSKTETTGNNNTAFDSAEQEIVPVILVPTKQTTPFVASPARLESQ